MCHSHKIRGIGLSTIKMSYHIIQAVSRVILVLYFSLSPLNKHLHVIHLEEILL